MIHFTIRDEEVYAVIYNYFPEGSNHNDDEYFWYQEYFGQAEKDKWHSLSKGKAKNGFVLTLFG
ncbi:MAG: hypothetical protein WBV21_14240 [Desulfobacterales bacterium]